MNKRRQAGKALPVLLLLLVVLGGAAGFMYYQDYSEKAKVKALEDETKAKQSITVTLRDGVIAIQDQTKKWPKNLEEIKSGYPAAAKLGKLLDDVTYQLVKDDAAKGQAVYRYQRGDMNPQDVRITAKSHQRNEPIGNDSFS